MSDRRDVTIISLAALAGLGLIAVNAIRQQTSLAAFQRHNRLQGLVAILADRRDRNFQDLTNYVRGELPRRMREPQFFEELDSVLVDRERHPELYLCDWYEHVGAFLKYGLVDEDALMDVSASSCNRMWFALEPVIRRLRRTRGETLYENFEYMAARGQLFMARHPEGNYPGGTPRMTDFADSRSRVRPAWDGTEFEAVVAEARN